MLTFAMSLIGENCHISGWNITQIWPYFANLIMLSCITTEYKPYFLKLSILSKTRFPGFSIAEYRYISWSMCKALIPFSRAASSFRRLCNVSLAFCSLCLAHWLTRSYPLENFWTAFEKLFCFSLSFCNVLFWKKYAIFPKKTCREKWKL